MKDPGVVYELPEASRDQKHRSRCHICKIYRVRRSHHCSKCGKCSQRMDHHCYWVRNCIGLSNYKYFLLFSAYITVAGFVESYCFSDYIFRKGPIYIENTYLKTIVYSHGILVLLFSIFTCALIVHYAHLIYHNITAIEQLAGIPMNSKPLCCVYGDSYSIYDMGMVPNMCQIFGSNPLTWLFPTPPGNTKYTEGLPTVPEMEDATIEVPSS